MNLYSDIMIQLIGKVAISWAVIFKRTAQFSILDADDYHDFILIETKSLLK